MGRPRLYSDDERKARVKAQKRAHSQRPDVKAKRRAYMRAYEREKRQKNLNLQ